MKNRVLGILVTGLIMVFLAGCGTKTETTNQAPESSEAVEADNVDETENAGEEAGKDTEDSNTFAGAEDENIVLYAEMGEQEYLFIGEDEYTERPATATAREDIPIYNGDGFQIGHIKANASVIATECAMNIAWSRFENPISGTEYDYIYVNNDYIVLDGSTVSAEEMKQIISDKINRILAASTIIDSPTSDMEVYELIISNKNDKSAIGFRLQETIFDYEHSDVYRYTTFAVECEEDADGEPYIRCKIYYKDLYDDVVNQ